MQRFWSPSLPSFVHKVLAGNDQIEITLTLKDNAKGQVKGPALERVADSQYQPHTFVKEYFSKS